MIILKTFHIVDESVSEEVQVKEYLDSSDYPLFTWPASLLLTAFLFHQRKSIQQKVILELGSGTALPSLVCGKLGARKVYVTEREDQIEMLTAIEESIQLNGLRDICRLKPLTWGYIPIANGTQHSLEENADIILGADVFYNTEDFDRILLTVVHFFVRNPLCVFYSTYQERSCFRTIHPLLLKYQLQAEVIDKSTFLHQCHFEGIATTQVFKLNDESEILNHEESSIDLEAFDDIFLLKITLKA